MGLLLDRLDVSVGIFFGDALNLLPGIILGVAFDEDDLGAKAEFRGAADRLFNIASLIPRRDDDRAL